MLRLRTKLVLAVLSAVLAVLVSAVLGACSQTPTSVPVRTFERAQRMDVACLQIYDPLNGFRPQEPAGRPQSECQPVPSDLNGAGFEKQLFAFVTQSTRGELAVVDLSAGLLIDQNRATPGINFLPVGALPTDVATTPDGKMAFVGSAEPNKAAIYGIPTRRVLGDTPGYPSDPEPLTLASWPVCALPQNPGALIVVPRRPSNAPATPADAGAADGGDGGDAGAGAVTAAPDYELVVVLPGDRRNSAKIVTLDPRPFLRGGLRKTADGKPDYLSDPTVTEGPVLQPGSLAPCPIIAAVELRTGAALPTTFVPGAKWDDGVKYVDGGVDQTCLTPTQAPSCGAPPCCDVDAAASDSGFQVDAAVPEGGAAPVPPPAQPDSGTCVPLGSQDAGGPIPLELGPLDPPHLVSIVRDDQMIYVADESVPLIHVLDMSVSGSPRELAPLLATSLLDPARVVKVTELALSPPTREYKRFLYAVDQIDGSLMVYDVTDPTTMQRTPLTRPHPELNPFQPPDRIIFSSPVVAVAFARHDLPLTQIAGSRIPNTASGILCNPNPRIDANPQSDLGFYYRAGSTDVAQAIGARRLRGIFGFATLANGQVIAIDVDDWDSPCRRPADMTKATSDIAPPQPDLNDTDPYHAPTVADLSVTREVFFPMTAPHSPRSEVLITNDPTLGNQTPRLQGPPTVTAPGGAILPQVGATSADTPLLDVRFALEDPHVHIDQDWRVTYEGALPGFSGVSAIISTPDAYSSLTVTQPQAHFCGKGVEDWAQGTERANRISQTLASRGVTPPVRLDRLMTDYLELTEEILAPEDEYWSVPQQCWDPALASPSERQNACVRTFGGATENNPQRSFPILEAYDDRVVLGRFFTSNGRREVVYKDPSNAPQLKLMQCCFHSQARFAVRTGQLWSAVGATVNGGAGGLGFLSHITTDTGGRCVPSCDPREALLNGRIPTVPPGTGGLIGRNSPLAMRNPMLATVIVGGASGMEPQRDTLYAFSSRGQFRPLFVAIGGSSIAVSPQSMRYVAPLDQIAVVDGQSQGLVLLDLRAFTLARAPYF